MAQMLTMLLTIAIDTYATFVRQPAAQAVAWALLQFVWQGTAIAAVTALLFSLLRRSAADVRYVVGSIGMAVMLTLPIVTGVQKYETLRASATSSSLRSDLDVLGLARTSYERKTQDATPASGVGESGQRASAAPARALGPVLMFLWLAGVTLLTLRLVTGWMWTQRMRTDGIRPARPEWDRVLTQLSRRLHITRAVALFESSRVDVPTVIGWLKPVVLLPASAIAALSPAQLEAILAHELAHIRRHDYLVNLLQTLVETLLFYHPAVWWISRRIRIERENCCDDLAVSLCGDPVAYANALADLESLRSLVAPLRHGGRTAMAATGGSLLERVRRLLGAPATHSGVRPAWLAASALLLIVGGMTAGAHGSQPPNAAAPAPATEPAPSLNAGEPKPAATVAAKHDAAPVRVAQAAPRAPAAPAPAAPSAPPAPPAPHSSSHSSNDSHGNWTWSNGGERLQADYNGSFDFTDDDTDVRQMSAGGRLRISDGQWGAFVGMFSTPGHLVEITERNGQIEHHYFVGGRETPFEPEGRAWLRDNLPKFVRNTGFNAPARVARLLKSGGVPAVLAEIGRVDGNYVRGIYYRELFKQATLSPEQYRQVLAQASSEMKGSNYELSQLLISLVDRLPNDEPSRKAYFNAASNLTGAYETGRVYSAMLDKGGTNQQNVAGILEHLKSLHSDYEVSQLLLKILAQKPLEPANGATLLEVAGGMGGDYERGRVLTTFLKQNTIEGALRAPFFRAVDAIHGSYERGQILQAVVSKSDVSGDTLKLAIQSTRTMGAYETSQVLLAVARGHAISGDLRDAYVDAANRLGEYEQGRVMTALVRSEHRNP